MSRLTSSFTCELISIIITIVIIHHSFTLSLQAQNLPFQQILPSLDLFYLPDCLHDNGTGPDLPCSSVLFLISHFNFLFVPCGGLSWLPVSFLLHVKYTLSYRIVSFATCCDRMSWMSRLLQLDKSMRLVSRRHGTYAIRDYGLGGGFCSLSAL